MRRKLGLLISAALLTAISACGGQPSATQATVTVSGPTAVTTIRTTIPVPVTETVTVTLDPVAESSASAAASASSVALSVSLV